MTRALANNRLLDVRRAHQWRSSSCSVRRQLASHLDHAFANVRKGSLVCLSKLSNVQLKPLFGRVVERLTDEDGTIALLAIQLTSRLRPSMDAAAWQTLLQTLAGIVMQDEIEPPLTATSFALDVLFETGGGASVKDLARSLDLGRLERALHEDLRETRSWRNKDRWEVKPAPRRFMHRASDDDIAWGLDGSWCFADVMSPYEKWHAQALERVGSARLEQISDVFSVGLVKLVMRGAAPVTPFCARVPQSPPAAPSGAHWHRHPAQLSARLQSRCD